MSRVKDLQKKVHKILKDMDDNQKHAGAIAHLHGVSLAAVMIAKKRGEDPEMAAMAGLLHDLYAYKSGSYDDHAHKGADYAREVLDNLGITDANETDLICSAIWHHDSKDQVDSPMDEILKDADEIHHSAVIAWMKANGYEPAGPMFNIYHVSPHETQNPDEFVTEICYPVKKK